MIADPVMVRIFRAVESLTDSGQHVCFEGEPGTGRRFLSAWLQARSKAPVRLMPEVHLSRPAQREAALSQARAENARVVATADLGAHLEGFDAVLRLPALRDRPNEVAPLAEAFLGQTRAALARPRLVLGPQAEALLLAHRWPGNLRELKNAMRFAAGASLRDEVGPDALPSSVRGEERAENLRGALKDTERELLLETLSRTRWNVTQAAHRLGLPRRTVVYRMARLGLRRPAR